MSATEIAALKPLLIAVWKQIEAVRGGIDTLTIVGASSRQTDETAAWIARSICRDSHTLQDKWRDLVEALGFDLDDDEFVVTVTNG